MEEKKGARSELFLCIDSTDQTSTCSDNITSECAQSEPSSAQAHVIKHSPSSNISFPDGRTKRYGELEAARWERKRSDVMTLRA